MIKTLGFYLPGDIFTSASWLKHSLVEYGICDGNFSSFSNHEASLCSMLVYQNAAERPVAMALEPCCVLFAFFSLAPLKCFCLFLSLENLIILCLVTKLAVFNHAGDL